MRFIPFNDRILDLADTAQIAVNLHNLIRILVVDVLVVRQDSLFWRLEQVWREPFDRIDVQQPLHAVEVYSNFDRVFLADLCDWLNARPLHHLHSRLALAVVAHLASFFLNVAMNPYEALLVLLNDVELEVSTVLCLRHSFLWSPLWKAISTINVVVERRL